MPSPPSREQAAFGAIVDAVSSTGAFTAVLFGRPAELDAIGINRVPVAVVSPVGWAEVVDGPLGAIRHVTYSLTILVCGDDGADRYAQLESLCTRVQDALDGSDLGGRCIAALTRFENGRYDLALKRGEGRVILAGTFAYAIPDIRNRD